MRINHNIAALNTHNQLTNNTNNVQSSLEKLSSGLQINRAGDDAAGLAISEKMRGQIRGLDMATKNAQDGISLIQTAEGALNETHSILQRMRELSVQAANDTNDTVDRDALQEEVDQLVEEIDRIADTTEFNGMNLINGDLDEGGELGELTLQIGANEDQELVVEIGDMEASELGESGVDAIDLSSYENADTAIGEIDDAIEAVSTQRSELGAVQNRLEHTINNLSTASENLTAAESRIRDVDHAEAA
ncbi:flagellin N-terminal helical domain-containing protein [Tenuibacillus multivorans]|uniref:Flagellin n=1 Tax=Tenuibacillus multivorans TaxID=237069 RepID=A0A1H0G849_9BACI|nr:flagellin [Tenuibacillus multivorans]GEL78706.1 flagellin [Tenuibacillus multivorans]SDO03046.1 flagellin [Tenuibacillus multivorans]